MMSSLLRLTLLHWVAITSYRLNSRIIWNNQAPNSVGFIQYAYIIARQYSSLGFVVSPGAPKRISPLSLFFKIPEGLVCLLAMICVLFVCL